MDKAIDFIITWVDSGDPRWQKEFEYYSAREKRTINTDACRYRDWDTLRYWFRGVEKFAPWVNKIFFVTYGHLPKWLNTDNPKLVIVKHEDFIPHEYLPTFNSNAIEFYFHKIEGLSDYFVYFNDDMFLIDNVSPERFFKKRLPCDIGALTTRVPDVGFFPNMIFMTIGIINQHFNKKEVVRKNWQKWYHMSYLRASLYNLLQIRRSKFYGFSNHHLPQGYMIKTYDNIWAHCENDIRRTCSNKFRSYGDISSWLLRYWQLASGNFTPCNVLDDGKLYSITEANIGDIDDCIRHQKKRIVCLNDVETTLKFKEYKQIILGAFKTILPVQSGYEL